MTFYQYRRWDGTQQVLSLDADELMDRLADHVISTGDLNTALRSLMRDNLADASGEPRGVDALLNKLRQRRRRILETYDLDSVVQGISQRLEEIERLEREGIARKLQEARERLQQIESGQQPGEGNERQLADVLERLASRNLKALDAMPGDAAGKLRHLRDYDFMDAEAREKYRHLAESLQQKVLERHFEGLTQRLKSMDRQTMGRLSEMLRDLNQLLRERAAGGQPNFRDFKKKYGDLLGPDSPDSLDDLAEMLQRQAAHMESLLESMSPQMRQQLQDLVSSVFDDETLGQMAELADNLDRLFPMRGLRRGYPFTGDEPATLDEALRLMQQLQGLDRLEGQLKSAQATLNFSEVDSRLMHELAGGEAVQRLNILKGIVRELEDAGYLRPAGHQYELTPRGARRIGQRALAEIFMYIKRSAAGNHATRTRGDGGDYVEDTKKYEYGDTFAPHLHRSLMNAVARQAGARGGVAFPLRLQPDDLEVYRTERVSRASTVLMIDLSLSMAMRGSFLAAKKVALALNNLIRSRFPHDSLYVVGFSTYARELPAESLPYLNWDEFDPYTNIQHALALAQRLMSKDSGGTRQILMVSDGEPTAHIEEGQLYLQYPPSPRTLAETLKEVKRCKSKGITINTFMLDRNVHLIDFVDQMTRISQGRVFYTTPEQLGHYLVHDYVVNRRHVIR